MEKAQEGGKKTEAALGVQKGERGRGDECLGRFSTGGGGGKKKDGKKKKKGKKRTALPGVMSGRIKRKKRERGEEIITRRKRRVKKGGFLMSVKEKQTKKAQNTAKSSSTVIQFAGSGNRAYADLKWRQHRQKKKSRASVKKRKKNFLGAGYVWARKNEK